MAASNPDEAEFNQLTNSGPSQGPSFLRHMVDPRTWTRSDWIVTIAPLVVEAAAAGAPEVSLPIIGAIDTARAFEFLAGSMKGRALVNAAAGALASKMEGNPLLSFKTGVGAASNTIGGLLGEGVAGVAKMVGRTVAGGLRRATLSRTGQKLWGLVNEHLPLLSSGSTGGASQWLGNAFRRATPGSRSAAEHIYGNELGKVEDKIEQNAISSRPASLQTRRLAMQAGHPLAGGVVKTQALFPVHVIDANHNWSVQHLPFKEAVSLMKEKWPKGYRFTGTERDTLTGAEWRRYRAMDSRAIGQRLKSLDPKLADEWQAARMKWLTSHHLSDIFSDPKSFDPVTGEVNSGHIARHLYGDTPGKIAHKVELQRAAGGDFANRFHAAVIHEAKAHPNLPQTQDIIGMPKELSGHASISAMGMPHLGIHLGHAGQRFTGTDIPFKEIGRPKIPYSLLRATGRHGTEQAKEGFFGEDD